jgi:hypothetical protein
MVTSLDMPLSVAFCAGTAAAMLVSPVRRSVPRWIEALIWIALLVACWLAITNEKEAPVRYLTESVAWGLDQIIKTSFGLILSGLLAWMSDHRYGIADAVVMLLGSDILLLALLRTRRQADALQPRILLGEWIEYPKRGAPAPLEVPYAMDEWNRRAERAAATLGVAFLTWLVNLMVWSRDLVIPRARAFQAQVVAAGRVAFGGPGHAMTDDDVINIQALLAAQSIGWYGPIVPAAPGVDSNDEEGREDESDRLAS